MNAEKANCSRFVNAGLAAIIIMLSLVFQATAQNRVGYVKDLKGGWLLNSQLLKRGQALPAGGRITFQPSNTSHSFINISDQNGRTIFYRNCDNQGECSRPIVLPNADASEPSIGSK